MRSSGIVCQVTNQDNQVEFTWSSGGGFFRPYEVTGSQLTELRQATIQVRKALEGLVYALNRAGDGVAPWEPSYELAEAGFRLFNYLLPTEDETARKVRRWLEELRRRGGLLGLELVVEERASDARQMLAVPWNLVYDERPVKHKASFQTGKSAERWRPFWSIRYNLSSGRRVEPLRRLPLWERPRVIAAISPDVYESMQEDQKEALDRFVEEAGLVRVGCLEELEAALEEGYPQLLYYLGHATPDYLTLGDDERITQSDLRNLLRSYDDRERPEGMLAFLNACQTAEAGETGSFLEVLHSFGFTGAIATEQQTIDNFANEMGLAFLDGFLRGGRQLGELLHALRLKKAPLGLLYGAHCPPEIRVKQEGDKSDSSVLTIQEVTTITGALLKGRSLLAPRLAPQPLELPEHPYRSLGYFDQSDRVLFTGRDADVIRFAATLDEPETRILILQGESGIGKSSFLRAGLAPYLEEECVGYRLLRREDGQILIIQVSKDPIGQVAQGLLDATALPMEYYTPEGETLSIDLRAVMEQVLGRPADHSTLREALACDPGLLANLLGKMAAPLPHALILVVDQAEELFTLSQTPAEVADRDHFLRMLQRLIDLKADVKLIITLRTEYYGRLLDHLRAGRRDFRGVRDELLRDFTLPSLIAAIERPTSEVPVSSGVPAPRSKYQFEFADGVAARIAEDVLRLRTEHQDSILPLMQVICTQLYDRKKVDNDRHQVIKFEDLEAIQGVEGGLRAFAESALEHSLGLTVADHRAFKSLFARLYSRQVDGTLTTWLASRDSLEKSWEGTTPFDRVVESARNVRLLRQDELRVEGSEPHPYIRLGHDALARVAAAWKAELEEDERLQQERAELVRERARRRRQLRKLLFATGAAVCVALLFGAVGLWALSQRDLAVTNAESALQSEKAAKASEGKAQENARRAEENLRTACQSLDDMLTEVADVELADIPQMESARRRLLEKAREGYEALGKSKDAEESRLLHWVVGRAHGRLGDILAMTGQHSEAEASYRKSIGILSKLTEDAKAGETPSVDDFRRDLVRAQLGLGVLYKDEHRYQEAGELLRAAAACNEPLRTSTIPADRQRMAELTYQRGVLWAREARSHGTLVSGGLEDGKAIEQAYSEALDIQKALTDGPPPRPDLKGKFARYQNNYAVLLAATGKPAAAEAELRLALSKLSNPLALPGERWQSARASHNLGGLLVERGIQARAEMDVQEGMALLASARDLLTTLALEFSFVPQYRQELAEVYLHLGEFEKARAEDCQLPQQAEIRKEHLTLALNDFQAAHTRLKGLAREFPGLPEYRLDLAIVAPAVAELLSARDPERAEEIVRESLPDLAMLAGQQPPVPGYLVAFGRANYEWAFLLQEMRKLDQARGAIDRSIALYRQALKLRSGNPEYREGLSDALDRSSLIFCELKDFPEAARVAEELLNLLPDDPVSEYKAASRLAECLEGAGDGGEEYGARAVRILQRAAENNRIEAASDLDDPMFAPLRNREDFRRLRDRLSRPAAVESRSASAGPKGSR